jgi:hypothetical protein
MTKTSEAKRRTTTETLSCKLTDAELRDKGDALAKTLDDIGAE